jgi:hypothetical protein
MTLFFLIYVLICITNGTYVIGKNEINTFVYILSKKKLTNRHYFLPKGGLATPKFQMEKNKNNNIKGLTDRGWLNHP